MSKPGFTIPHGTELRPWPGATFVAGDEAALSDALSEAQIIAFIASGHLHPTLVDGPTTLSPRVLFVYPTAQPDENTYQTWEAAHLAALSMNPTPEAPVAVRFPDTLMPETINVAAMRASHILVSDAAGGSGSGSGGALVIWVPVDAGTPNWAGAAAEGSVYSLTYDEGSLSTRYDVSPVLPDGYMHTGCCTVSVNSPIDTSFMAEGMPVGGVHPWGARVDGGYLYLSANLDGSGADGAICLLLPL